LPNVAPDSAVITENRIHAFKVPAFIELAFRGKGVIGRQQAG
jgi:hypothetical protein